MNVSKWLRKEESKVLYRARRLTVLILVFSFLVTPLMPALAAQEKSSDTAMVSDPLSNAGAKTDDSSLATDNANKKETDKSADIKVSDDKSTGNDKAVSEDSSINIAQSMASASTATGQQEGGDSVSKSALKQLLPQADQASGALIYEYPIIVSPGRKGMQPDLKLTYNNQNVERGSVLGAGWSINIPYIERINRKGTDKLYSEDYFTSSLSGELLLISGNQWGAKLDDGSFLQYVYANNSWTVKDKSGTTYIFGSVSATRQDNPNDSTKIYKWMLEEVRDVNDNYIRYEYFKDNGQIYPSKVIYTGNGTTDGVFEIDFLRETRTDNFPLYKIGFSVASNYRISEIDAKINNILIKKYVFAYDIRSNSIKSLLSSVTESGYDESGNVSTLPPTVFQYGSQTTTNWTKDTSWIVPSERLDVNGKATHIADVNGDGLPDIINNGPLSYYNSSGSLRTINNLFEVSLNNGHGWSTGFTLDPTLVDIYGIATRLMDVNGDGLVDIVNSGQVYYKQYGSITSTLQSAVYINNGNVTDLLDRITNARGGSISVTYKASPQYTDESTLINPNLPSILQTVSQITNNDGFGNTFSQQYQYEGGRLYYNNAFDRQFVGFSKVTTTDNAGNKTINYYHQGDATNSNQGEYNDHISKAGKIYRTEITNSSGNIYSKTINKWDRYGLGKGRNFVKQVQKIDMMYDGDSVHKDSAETYTYDNAAGNLTQKVQLGEVTGSDNGTYTDIGTDDFTTSYAYASNALANIIGLPDDITVTDHNSNKIKEDKYYYDNQSFGGVEKGNETKHEMWKSGTSYISTQKTYDGTYGLVAQETDANGKNTVYGYDSYYLYPATVTDPLNHTTSYLYNYSCGKVKQKTDPNNRAFQYAYDGLDRITAEKQPDLTNPSVLIDKTIYTYTDTSGAVKVQRADYLDGSNPVNTYTYFDGLGRKIQERKQAEGSNYEVKDHVYNNLDLLQRESLPYFSSGSARTGATAASNLYTTYAYDPLYRITAATDAAGTVTNSYNDLKLTVTDKRGKTKDLYKDAYGNLIRVDEHNSGNTYTTIYNYDGLKNLIGITDALGNIRNFTYDGLGRRLTAEDLHAVGDTSYGIWTYAYDDNGNLISKTDPKSQTVNYTYDYTNRVLTEDYTGQAGTEVTYIYDSGTDGIGRLYYIIAPSYTQTNTYNPLGNLASESKVINSNAYVTSYAYDRQGNQLTITNPDNSVVRYEYGTGGLLNKVSRKESTDPSYIYVVSNIDYSPMEQITRVTYSNGMAATNTYDSKKLYRLSSKVTTIAGGVRGQSIAYAYDNNGNITRIVDSSGTDSKKTVAYAYDDLNRLTSATATNVATGQSPYTENYAYNAIGNITSKTGQGSYTYAGNQGTSYANPHAATIIGSTALAYDNNGNLLTKGAALSNTWDYNNRLTQSVAGSITDSYAYDVSGERIKLSNGTTTTIYPTKLYNTDSATPTKHIFANGVEIAAITGTGASAVIHYTATDHLTGSSLTTDASNNQEELLDYMPFGTIRIDKKAGIYSDQRKYAGHEFDNDTGLSYMDARYYDGAIGRFLSEDPLFLAVGNPDQVKAITGQDLTLLLADPQSLNSYAYARNNPLRNIDATGEYWETAVDLISFGLSIYDFSRQASWFNAAFVGLDAAAVVSPLPAIAGYVKNGGRIASVSKYFAKTSRSAEDAVRLGRLFIENAGFKFTRRAWSSGEAGNDVASLVGHFVKHGDEVGAKNVGDYYHKANNFISNKSYNYTWVEKGGDRVYYNSNNRLIGVTANNGTIRSFYKVTTDSKLAEINKIIKK